LGTHSLRRLRARRNLQEIEVSRARWHLRFYVWGSFLMLSLATIQTLEVAMAFFERRPPRLLLPMLDAVSDWIRGHA
jgi:hypothetical protein